MLYHPSTRGGPMDGARKFSIRLVVAAATMFLAHAQTAALKVYVTRTGDPDSDAAVVAALRARGHSVSLGLRAIDLNLVRDLSSFHVVVGLGVEKQTLDTPAQTVLKNYVQNGGGFVADS